MNNPSQCALRAVASAVGGAYSGHLKSESDSRAHKMMAQTPAFNDVKEAAAPLLLEMAGVLASLLSVERRY